MVRHKRDKRGDSTLGEAREVARDAKGGQSTTNSLGKNCVGRRWHSPLVRLDSVSGDTRNSDPNLGSSACCGWIAETQYVVCTVKLDNPCGLRSTGSPFTAASDLLYPRVVAVARDCN